MLANHSDLTEDEYADLVHAFRAFDTDQDDAVNEDEFHALLQLLGSSASFEQVKTMIDSAKDRFYAWKCQSDAENVAKARRLWNMLCSKPYPQISQVCPVFDSESEDVVPKVLADSAAVEALNYGDVNKIIVQLNAMGSDLPRFTATEFHDEFGETMTFDCFADWFLETEGLPKDFQPIRDTVKLAPMAGLVSKTVGAVWSNLKMAKDFATEMAEAAVQHAHLTEVQTAASRHLTAAAGAAARQARNVAGGSRSSRTRKSMRGSFRLTVDARILAFPEFVFMMKSGSLDELFSPAWQELAHDLRKIREGFDAADVDGDNQIELDELELIILSMAPEAHAEPDDIARVWAVLNPSSKAAISFTDFARGMIAIKRDPELHKIVPFGSALCHACFLYGSVSTRLYLSLLHLSVCCCDIRTPNRFQLLSLLIDTPINSEAEKRLLSSLSFLERIGIQLLQSIQHEPLSPAEKRRTIEMICAGKLHHLTDAQRKQLNWLNRKAVARAMLIGTFCCFWPGLFENFLVWTYATDGVYDAYWTCADFIGDPSAAPWGTNATFTLPVCRPGLCTSIPQNVTEFLAEGGSIADGGRWTDGDGPCPLTFYTDGRSPGRECDPVCTDLLHTYQRDVNAAIMFWCLNMLGITIGIIIELKLLMDTAVRSAVKVAECLDLRLTPLNPERSFVAKMLVRAAFDLQKGKEEETMGVQSKQADSGSGNAGSDGGGMSAAVTRNPVLNVLAVAFLKGKVVLTGLLFKQITARSVSYDTATWLKPYTGTMLATALWDGMMLHAVVKQSENRAIGVTTGVEVFNDIIDRFCPTYTKQVSSLSNIARLQILRAIGVAIVKHGLMLPTLELLLRHAIGYLDMKSAEAVRKTGMIDDEDAFLRDFDQISLEQSQAVLCIHMLAYTLSGTIGFVELSLWTKLLVRVEDVYQATRKNIHSLNASELRRFVVGKTPCLSRAVDRVPQTGGPDEIEELQLIAEAVPQPEHVTKGSQRYFSSLPNVDAWLIPRVVCQKFRNRSPITTHMLMACYDPQEMNNFIAEKLTSDEMTKFTFNELTHTFMTVLTRQI
eukprot:SAG11_NODE_263_length_11526_cov_23.830314_4_plen_1064_part_00